MVGAYMERRMGSKQTARRWQVHARRTRQCRQRASRWVMIVSLLTVRLELLALMMMVMIMTTVAAAAALLTARVFVVTLSTKHGKPTSTSPP